MSLTINILDLMLCIKPLHLSSWRRYHLPSAKETPVHQAVDRCFLVRIQAYPDDPAINNDYRNAWNKCRRLISKYETIEAWVYFTGHVDPESKTTKHGNAII